MTIQLSKQFYQLCGCVRFRICCNIFYFLLCISCIVLYEIIFANLKSFLEMLECVLMLCTVNIILKLFALALFRFSNTWLYANSHCLECQLFVQGKVSLEGFSYLFMIRNEVCCFDSGDFIVSWNITAKDRCNYFEFFIILDSM